MSPPAAPTTASRAAPLAAGVVGAVWVAGAGVLARNDAVAAAVPVGCPFKALTGLDCPGCGSTRSLGALTRFDVVAAFDHHVAVPAALVLVVASWVLWTASVWRDRPRTDLVRGRAVILVIAVGLLAFTVLRNLDVGAWLASDLSAGAGTDGASAARIE
jgi:hypothetical protein